MTTSTTPTFARVSSLTHWTNLFHPVTGAFRLPSTAGEYIEHLDIDLRFVHCEFQDVGSLLGPKALEKTLLPSGPVHLPKVCLLTLRGAEHCQDCDESMEALAEVLGVIRPVEVRWLNASTDPREQVTFATHLVHDAIIQAGHQWAMHESLRKLVIQGGFPCPNLTAPTPFNLTPATTPASSPGPHRTTFGTLASALPSLSTIKPKAKVVDEDRLKARAERQRLAEYTLKPRFEFAFGSWGAESIHWRLDGRYTSTCIKSIAEQLFKALNKTWPHPATHSHLPLPSLFVFTPLDPLSVSKIRALPDALDLSSEMRDYIDDVFFFTAQFGAPMHARMFEQEDQVPVSDRSRQARRLKAEMILLHNGPNVIVELAQLIPSIPDSTNSSEAGTPPGTAKDQLVFRLDGSDSSPGSLPSIMTDHEGGVSSDEEDAVAMTPDLGTSLVMDEGAVTASDRGGGGCKSGPIPIRQGSWGV
ncbi:hypothetical protein BD324DRAFT_80738 [Kockovaella imperatae]|uniref:Uncharacterized protein n=1 Tax=Kockovaella imperatae TaxID=4999 RepID=A0A1Y1UCN1_9TREE|nr:hypothetical protein BD324DRAFT_80738 [Kockovaella imperatae]ORX35800.1 hypothetical protein BD324DRAFT_80738 [Kockovaella imperatae]